MALSIEQARELGRSKLRIDNDVFNLASSVADEMEVKGENRPAMILAIAILKLSRVDMQSQHLEGELRDALALVQVAEKEWKLERMGFRK